MNSWRTNNSILLLHSLFHRPYRGRRRNIYASNGPLLPNYCFAMITILALLMLFHVVSSLKGKSPDEAPGVVLLDSITFPKVVPSCNAHILVLFLNKQQIGQPTTDGSRDNFLEVARGTYLRALYSTSSFILLLLTSNPPFTLPPLSLHKQKRT